MAAEIAAYVDFIVGQLYIVKETRQPWRARRLSFYFSASQARKRPSVARRADCGSRQSAAQGGRRMDHRAGPGTKAPVVSI